MMKPGGSGWNDPPKLSHQVHSETKTRRNLLNKRVAYLDSKPTSSNKNVTLSPDIPPPTNTVVKQNVETRTLLPELKPPINIFVPHSKAAENLDTSSTEKDDSADQINDFEYDENVDIIQSLRSINNQCKNVENVSTTDVIEKKLDILKSMLDERSLSEPVITGMRKITNDLLNKQHQKAWDVHVSLMCDHVSEVRLWMVGVRRLINELKKAESTEDR